MNCDINMSDVIIIAYSRTDGIADDKYYLAVPRLGKCDEQEYLILQNFGDSLHKECKVLYRFTSECVRGSNSCFAISQDVKTLVIGYATKKGVFCIDCENGQIIWNNAKIRKIDRVRFNNFEQNIIEIINTKLEITYLDKATGQVLGEERIKNIRQTFNDIRSSKNQEYLIVCDTFSSKDMANYSVYETKSKKKVGSFVAQCGSTEKAFDITNDGRLAVCSSYYRYGISLIEVETGNVLWTTYAINSISSLYFDKKDEKVIVKGSNCSVYVLNIQDGNIEERKQAEALYLNQYGDDIALVERNKVLIDSKEIEGPSFSYLRALGIPNGVVLVPAGEGFGLQCYDDSGNLIWENDMDINNITYQEKDKTICGYLNRDGNSKCAVIDASNGQVLCKKEIEDYMCAFIDDGHTLVCNTGKLYRVSKKEIEEKDDIFAFIV